MKLDITDSHFIELYKKGYTVDMVLLLSWVNNGLSIEHLKENIKIKATISTMIRKGLITDEHKLTQIGVEILSFVSKKTNKKFTKPAVIKGDFDDWWKLFPSNDKFTVKGKSFGPTRSFTANKQGCRLLFNKMILNKEFTKEEIMESTAYDINLKKERSFKEGTNNLKYLRNSYTYLFNKDFEGFIGLGTPIVIKEKTKLRGTNI